MPAVKLSGAQQKVLAALLDHHVNIADLLGDGRVTPAELHEFMSSRHAKAHFFACLGAMKMQARALAASFHTSLTARMLTLANLEGEKQAETSRKSCEALLGLRWKRPTSGPRKLGKQDEDEEPQDMRWLRDIMYRDCPDAPPPKGGPGAFVSVDELHDEWHAVKDTLPPAEPYFQRLDREHAQRIAAGKAAFEAKQKALRADKESPPPPGGGGSGGGSGGGGGGGAPKAPPPEGVGFLGGGGAPPPPPRIDTISAMTPNIVVDRADKLGEGPMWIGSERRLYWVDIDRAAMLRYEPAGGKHEVLYQATHPGAAMGAAVPQADGAWLLFMERGKVLLWRDGKVERTLIDIQPGQEKLRFNDSFADPEGRVFCGVMSMDPGAIPGWLGRLDRDGSMRIVADNIGVSNGMGFTPDLKHMYYTDSTNRVIWKYRYDRKTGDLSDRKAFVKLGDNDGYPDGMTVDADGDVWSAVWNGWRVSRYSPDGKEKDRITFPAQRITSATFGGEKFDQMYVTSAGGDDRATLGPAAGALFRVDAGVRGVPEFLARVGL